MSKTASINSVNNINEKMNENLERRRSSLIKQSALNLPEPNKNNNFEGSRRNEAEKINLSRHRRNHSHMDSVGICSVDSQKLNYSQMEYPKDKTNLGNYSNSPQYIPNNNSDNRQKTIICWNCNQVLLVGDDWDIVQCTHCDKLSKIPDNPSVRDSHQLPDKYDSGRNHFETNVPYIFVITICPYCGKQNKVHKGTQHMVCYKCHHSVNIESDASNKVKVVTGASTLAAYKPSPIRSIRFSQLTPQNQIMPVQSLPPAQIMYPTNMTCMNINVPPVYGSNCPMDNYNRYYQNSLSYNCYPSEYINNCCNPAWSVMMDYNNRNRMKRECIENERRYNEKRYEDKVVKDEIKKLKENIDKIKIDLGMGGNSHIDSKNYKTPFRKNLNDIKDGIENNKSIKNEAMYKSMITRK